MESMDACVQEDFEAFHGRFCGLFRRSESRIVCKAYLRGLMAKMVRRNCWQLAETLGEPLPDSLERLLYRTLWDADEARDVLQRFEWEQFGGDDAVGILDETGFVKRGRESVGVRRQYTGTVGKVENCQVAVFLSLATSKGHVLLDRRLYLPEEWCADAERRDKACVPREIGFQTKPQLGLEMLEHAWEQGVRFRWVVGDEVYGDAPYVRHAISARGQWYVMTVSSTTPVWQDRPQVDPEQRSSSGRLLRQLRVAKGSPPASLVAQVVADWPQSQWERLQVAEGEKGPIVYDWGRQAVVESCGGLPGQSLWLMARRSVTKPDDVDYYLSNAPDSVPLSTMADVATRRWAIEQCFEEAKGETGLDEYEVRLWHSWHRHVTLVMMAHAWLASVRARANEAKGGHCR